MLTARAVEPLKAPTDKHFQALVDVLYSNGLIRKISPTDYSHMPVSLNPKIIPKEAYVSLKAHCLDFHKLLKLLYEKFEKLLPFLENYCGNDQLLKNLLKIHKTAQNSQKIGPKKAEIVILRNDFMYDAVLAKFLQVEFNTIAVGLGQFTTILRGVLHQFYSSFYQTPLNFAPSENSASQIETFQKAFELYGNPAAVILFVVLDYEPSIFDIAPNEHLLADKGIIVQRILFSELRSENYHLEPATGKLFVHGAEVAVIYLRSLYAEEHLNPATIDFWVSAETSTALLIPSVKSFLIGIKLTQHLFSSDKLLQDFGMLSEVRANSFNEHLCPTLTLTTDFANDRAKMLQFVRENEQNLLLKTYKEGGVGFLLSGPKIAEFVETSSLEDLASILLAHKIDAPTYETFSMSNGDTKFVKDSVSEVSIYSSYIFRQKNAENGEKSEEKYEILYEKVWDYLVRSKPKSEDRGGISVGVACLDTLVFPDDEDKKV